MNQEQVVVDLAKCREMANRLMALAIPADAEEQSEHTDLDSALVPDFYWVLVAICHQTSPKPQGLEGVVGGQRLVGWDYLREALAAATRRNPAWLWPDRLAVITASDIERMVRDLDSAALLTRLEERAQMLREMGQWIVAKGHRSITGIYGLSQHRVDSDAPPGLLQLLGQVEAYSDPVRKKSFFFLALMMNHGIWTYVDPHRIGPPVDYHEVRGHLRCGTVIIQDQSLLADVREGRMVRPDADVAIRRAVYDAIVAVADMTGYSPSQLHYFFWNVFRSCCRGQATHCDSCVDCRLPDRYAILTRANGRQVCAVAESCVSRGKESKISEHRTTTHFY